MNKSLIFMPTFRVRQEEVKVLLNTDFGENMYPLVEIVKEFDRKSSKPSNQKTFEEVHLNLINQINAKKVFVDLPNYLTINNSVSKDVVAFNLKVVNNIPVKINYINKLSPLKDKIIPVISSYYRKNGSTDSIIQQEYQLRLNYDVIAYRVFIETFNEDMKEVYQVANENDYLIIDIGRMQPFATSSLRNIVNEIKNFKTSHKILLRSAINTDIENTNLINGQIILNADNSHLNPQVLKDFGVNSVGDYCGVKKDNITSGGAISPGFIYFDATENNYYGFNSVIKDLSEFKNTIVPTVLKSDATKRMLSNQPPFLTTHNHGYQALLDIQMQNGQNDKSRNQAKFKKIAMDHYIYCIRILIESKKIKLITS